MQRTMFLVAVSWWVQHLAWCRVLWSKGSGCQGSWSKAGGRTCSRQVCGQSRPSAREASDLHDSCSWWASWMSRAGCCILEGQEYRVYCSYSGNLIQYRRRIEAP